LGKKACEWQRRFKWVIIRHLVEEHGGPARALQSEKGKIVLMKKKTGDRGGGHLCSRPLEKSEGLCRSTQPTDRGGGRGNFVQREKVSRG